MAWFKYSSNNSTLFSQGTSGPYGWSIAGLSPLMFYASSTPVTTIVPSIATLTPGVWVHIAVVYKGLDQWDVYAGSTVAQFAMSPSGTMTNQLAVGRNIDSASVTSIDMSGFMVRYQTKSLVAYALHLACACSIFRVL